MKLKVIKDVVFIKVDYDRLEFIQEIRNLTKKRYEVFELKEDCIVKNNTGKYVYTATLVLYEYQSKSFFKNPFS